MTTMQFKPIAILGAGSWGTALGLHLARLGQRVHLWTLDKTHAELMLKEGVNRKYLPEQLFPDTLKPTSNLANTISDVDEVLIAVPSAGFRSTLELLKPLLKPKTKIVFVTKGIDHATGLLLHEVAKNILTEAHPLAVLSGPSFASEVAKGLPTAVVVASSDIEFAKELQLRFNSPRFRVYLSDDVVGVEVGGATKNVLAIATGISDGMGFGANARSALITRGLAEIMRLGLSMGAKAETLMGLTGLGDLILTCTDNQSRNRRFGLLIGQNYSMSDAEKSIGQVVEGKRNAELIQQLSHTHQVEMPIVDHVVAILKGEMTPEKALQQLLARKLKSEQ